jgi:hypothetical protein
MIKRKKKKDRSLNINMLATDGCEYKHQGFHWSASY